jgi:paraquat-inducible protein A
MSVAEARENDLDKASLSEGERRATTTAALMACHDCGRLLRVPLVSAGRAAKCFRCGAFLFRVSANGIDRALHLNLAALILFVLANVFPFMTFKLEGREQQSEIISGVLEFYNKGLWPLALLVFLVTLLVPLLKLLGTLYVLVPLRVNRRPPWGATVFRWVETIHPWAMMEVYLLGVLVAYVKLIDLATLELGIASFSFAALIVVMIAAEAALEPHAVWDRLGPTSAPLSSLTKSAGTLVDCHSCGLISRIREVSNGRFVCPRCGAVLHQRKPNSIARTWALVLTAAILYIPANVYPVMTVISFGQGEPDTILSGIKHLVEAGMWPLALLVFFASITVPMLKLIGLGYLLVSVQRQSRWRPRDRTRLYRMIEAVGRWSMLDIFMISILIALVKLGSIATIEPGIGATSFAAVVVVTMIASLMFDPRLIWDAVEPHHGR